MVNKQELNGPLTVVGMVNGMIGGLILILPLLAMNAGWLLTLIVIFVTGIFSYYSCYLCIEHMGDAPDLDVAILRHFNGSKFMKNFYDLCVWSNLFLILLLYFQLIVQQWQGLAPPFGGTVANPLTNTAILFISVFLLKYFQFGASIMAYGIISIIGYSLFLIWVVVTVPSGQNHFKPFGTGAVGMAAAMGQAFSIQAFFIPILKKNKNSPKYSLYTLIAYAIGAFAYYYIAYMGYFGILNRNPTTKDPQTIEDYFGPTAWQVRIIEGVYLIHLYSVFPQFLLISKKRIFGVFGISQSQKGIPSLFEICYFIILIALCLVVDLTNVQITDIIDINGAVIGFFFIYFLPALLHVKCVYFSRGKRKLLDANQPIIVDPMVKIQASKTGIEISQLKYREDNNIQASLIKHSDQQRPSFIKSHTQPLQSDRNRTETSPFQDKMDFSFYRCNVERPSRTREVIDIVLMSIMVLMGAFIMVNGIMAVAQS